MKKSTLQHSRLSENKRGPKEPKRRISTPKKQKISSKIAKFHISENQNSIKQILYHKQYLQFKESKLLKLEKQLNDRDQKQKIKKSEKDYGRLIEELENKLSDKEIEFNKFTEKSKEILTSVLREYTKLEKKMDKEYMVRDGFEVGMINPFRNGHIIEEKFVYGELQRKISAERTKLSKRLKEITESKRKLQAKKKNYFKTHKKNEIEITNTEDNFDEFNELEEILKVRGNKIKKDLLSIEAEEKTLSIKVQTQINRIKRIKNEENSNFNNMPILKDRYLLLRLIGKGGFSEVWKSYDLEKNTYVACKIHQLNMQWSDERKKNYIKHATREYEIHRSLSHPKIVPLFDVFGIDINSFCTVLRFCNGSDLEKILKLQRYLTEKETKLIILQIFQGLKYLSENTGVIHYDLKPGNILFHNGEVQITDFGLSKKIEDSDILGMELTSQGAGTYWYLPPETFESNSDGPPIITSKVDVWSAGVIVYQMLFGIRPFGHDLSQDSIIKKGTLKEANLSKVEFPSTPKVSNEAKEFISLCLTINQSLRPDANTVLKHSFFDTFRRKNKKI